MKAQPKLAWLCAAASQASMHMALAQPWVGAHISSTSP
jgi:hypothetical protein